MSISAIGSNRPKTNGFTLVELMVVLVIIGLMSAAVVLAIPDPRGRVVDEAERFAARALAVRDVAILESRDTSLRIDGRGYRAERRAQGRWEPALERSRPVEWTAGTGIAAPSGRISFDPTGAVAAPMIVTLTREGAAVRVEIPADGAVRVLG